MAAERSLPLGIDEGDAEQAEILELLKKPSGSQEKFKKRWIEFDCQKGVHHGKYSTYENRKRIRVKGGHLGRLDKVRASGRYGEQRVYEFIANHNCRHPERFLKDLDECGISSIGIEGWPSGRSAGGLSDSERPSGSEGNDLHRA